MTLKNEYKQKTPLLREAEERAMPIYVLKSNTIPQMQSSLTSIFSLEIDPREAAMRETEDAIEAVLSSSEAVELSPQNAYIRRLQHQMAERANLVSRSRGREPFRRVRLYPDAARSALALTGRRPLGLRAGLGRLSTGLIAYGAIGLTIALIAAAALAWTGVRVGGLAGRTAEQVETIIATLDATSEALTDAASTATSFAVTLERTPPVVRQSAQTIGDLRTELRSVENQLAGLSLLGSRPLANVAGVFGRMAADVEGLDTRLGLIATDLEGNKAALLANSASLRAVGTRIGQAADDLRGGVIEDGLADVQSAPDAPVRPAHHVDRRSGDRGAAGRAVAPPRAPPGDRGGPPV